MIALYSRTDSVNFSPHVLSNQQEIEMAEEFATVRVSQGVLRGKKTTAEAGNSFFSFEGVPYARPPVGPLRFKEALPPYAWNGVRNALEVGAACPQVDNFLKIPLRGDEDCLYLNVYTPKLPVDNERNYPVMVWIHGGGFLVGSGDMLSAEYLVNEEVVVVTINYRLGVFGFLSVDDENHPKNLGLKDQVSALCWLKDNVAAFGGDPNNVTIFGESAGAACVHYHILSPMSKGLFHKAILQSGCALNPWALDPNPQNLALALAEALGCTSTSTDDVLECLSTAPAFRLVETYDELARREGGKMGLRFTPVVEKRVLADEEVFLPEHPDVLAKRETSNPVPCIIGVNSQEGILFLGLANIHNDPSVLGVIGKHLDSLLPKDVISKTDVKTITEQVKRFYFKNENISETSILEYINFMSDTMFIRGVDRTTNILEASGKPIYFYHFDFDGKLNLLKSVINAFHLPGAAHLDELGYLFGTTFFNIPHKDVADDSREGLTRKRMVRLWTNFAKTGNPTPTLDSIVGTIWPQFSSANREYLNISDTICVERDLFKERIDFWNNM